MTRMLWAGEEGVSRAGQLIRSGQRRFEERSMKLGGTDIGMKLRGKALLFHPLQDSHDTSTIFPLHFCLAPSPS